MGSRRQDVDLFLLLTDPLEARKWIANYDFSLPPYLRPDHFYVEETGRIVFFETMEDDEAVIAAQAILRQREVPMAMMEKREHEWAH